MLTENEDGTLTAGPLDVMIILYHKVTGRYHAAFFEESPAPNSLPSMEQAGTVRLKSKAVHESGADDIEGAKKHVREFRQQIHIPDKNVFYDPVNWDGGMGLVLLRKKWT